MITKTQPFKIYGMLQKLYHSDTGLSQKRRKKPQINNLTYHLKELEKEEQLKPKASRRKKIMKIREEVRDSKNNTKKNQ